MFKASIFNYYLAVNDNSIIYNSLTGALVCIQSGFLLQPAELIRFYQSTGEGNQQVLLKYGLVVKEETDEDKIASVKLLDIISNKDLYLTILPTYSCNFRCKYCYENDGGNMSFKEISMSEELQSRIIQYAKNHLSDYHCMMVEWHGGEPLKQIGIIKSLSKKLIDVSNRLGKPYVGTVTTNGYYLNRETVLEMIKNHIIQFHVTLDGFPWNHDYYRTDCEGHATFDKIMRNLLDIRDNVCQKNFHIVLRTNVTRKFLPYLDDWLHYISENFSDDNRFQVYIKMVEDKGGHAVTNMKDDLLESESDMYDIIANSKHCNNYEYYYSSICNSICSAAMRNKHIITPDGIVRKCGHYLFDKRSEVGRLGEDGYICYNRDNFSKWINAGKQRIEKCSKCVLWASCFNSFCILKSELSAQIPRAVCSGEHQNIEKIVKILLSPYNTKRPSVQYLYL